MLSVDAVQTTKPTRKESTELTRRRLIDGAIEIFRREGVASATTGRIASAAGLKQPSFYVHFADRDAVLGAAAAEIGERMLGRLERQLTKFDPGNVKGSIRSAYESIVAAFLAEPELTRIFLRHRTDDGTVLGRVFRGMVDQARSQLVESFPRYGLVVPRHTAQAHVELLVAGMLGLLEGLLDGRLRDREVAVDALALVTNSTLRSLYKDRRG